MDEFLNGVLTTQLFAVNGSGMDLASLNIQRQRDHGMSSFGVWKSFCERIFPDLYLNYTGIGNPMTLLKLLQVYGSLETIDLWVGGISESTLPSSLVGPTFTCIFGLTFKNVRDGDRFWYQRRAVFNLQQQAAITSTTLASVICANTGINRLQRDVFQIDPSNRVQCSNIPSLDLSLWREEECYMRLVATNREAEGIDMKVKYTTHDGTTIVSTNNFLFRSGQPTCVPIQCPSTLNDERIVVVPTDMADRNRCTLTPNPRLPEDNATDVFRYRGFSFGENHIGQRNGIFHSITRCLRPNAGRPAISVTCTPSASSVTSSSNNNNNRYNRGGVGEEKDDCNYSSEIDGCELSQEEFDEGMESWDTEEAITTKGIKDHVKVSGGEVKDKELFAELKKTLQEIN